MQFTKFNNGFGTAGAVVAMILLPSAVAAAIPAAGSVRRCDQSLDRTTRLLMLRILRRGYAEDPDEDMDAEDAVADTAA